MRYGYWGYYRFVRYFDCDGFLSERGANLCKYLKRQHGANLSLCHLWRYHFN